jgi:hypothetical protein
MKVVRVYATCNITLEYTMKGPSHGSLGRETLGGLVEGHDAAVRLRVGVVGAHLTLHLLNNPLSPSDNSRTISCAPALDASPDGVRPSRSRLWISAPRSTNSLAISRWPPMLQSAMVSGGPAALHSHRRRDQAIA